MIKKLVGAALAAALLTTGVAEAKPKARTGVVVHKSYKAKGFVVANAKGRMAEVRSAKRAGFGRKVSFRGRSLANGSFHARSVSVEGRSTSAKVRGAVTFVDETARTFTVSGNGASILVHLADTTQALPAVGDAVLVIADLSTSTATTLEATSVVVNPAAAEKRTVEIEGVVLGINDATRTLTLSADDSEESGEMVAVVLPADIDITKFAVGDSVELYATLNDDGETFTATGVDDHNCGDDDNDDGDHDRGDDDDRDDDNSGSGREGSDDHGDDDDDDTEGSDDER